MTIVPVNGTIYVTQGNLQFGKVYESSFPDTKEGMKEAYDWAETIALGWQKCQDEDWSKHHAA